MNTLNFQLPFHFFFVELLRLFQTFVSPRGQVIEKNTQDDNLSPIRQPRRKKGANPILTNAVPDGWAAEGNDAEINGDTVPEMTDYLGDSGDEDGESLGKNISSVVLKIMKI